ncbi:sodium-dependent transporter [Bacillus paralicheniformis]|uniref:sodium-dependent transporter n=1 Tax=Bacillus paralicheniformis TaxID=1648923 RepID=UPI002DBA29FE|nr:sodium-dependent transporter [Bacillus paralicheniformis]MEC1087884.1 sodium-dependent transporter [Bacillus paralicheniformis]MEC1104540.1 sodium-dependent transporter [Bacillus paralicheniformis]MEC1112608.1 sodium-dependent transporter [Bacillus paralicheniformis]MEC1139755.1 sodium-dependent transporter [Bacillus paralicheniformis]MEC1146546.1 sodium-dependent transporter [Bacillus paralicheniformis]
MENKQNIWSSKLGFILASAGSAIGLGAIWKFPYVAGTSGGGAFLLMFILFTLLIGLPLLMAEFIIGRKTQKDAVESYKELAPGSLWHWIGRLGIITCFILLSFYSVVGGWIIIYIIKGLTGELSRSTDYAGLFGETIANPYLVLASQFAFIMITILVVSKGVRSGIEKASKFMMPALFIIFLLLIIRSLTLPGSMEGLEFFLKPDLSHITAKTVLFALGQSFFSLSVGVSVMVTYSSYLSKKENLVQSAVSVTLLNVSVAILAGFAIFPAVFSFGLSPDAGPMLLFNVLPSVFHKMPLGIVFLLAFMLLFLFATLTSAFSMLEILVSSLSKGDPKKRQAFAWAGGIAIFLFGIPSTLSYGVLQDVSIFNLSIFDAADYLVSNILMPLGALLIAVFVPLKIPKDELFAELKEGSKISRKWFAAWLLLIRYAAPIVIIVVFLDVIGVF